MFNCILGVELAYVQLLKDALREYAIKNSWAIKYVMNDKVKVRAKCVEDCTFLLYPRVKANKKTFKVKNLNVNRTCRLVFNNPRIDFT